MRLRAADQAVAENVLLGDDDEFVGLEAGFQRQHGKCRLPRLELVRFGKRRDRLEIAETMLGQDLPSRSSEPSVQPAMTTLRRAARSSAMCFTTTSKTLTLGSARSSTKARPWREPAWKTFLRACIRRVEGA